MKPIYKQIFQGEIENIKQIGHQVKYDDPRWDKSCEVNWLCSEAGKHHAIALQLENLINTYGYQSVIHVLYNKRGE